MTVSPPDALTEARTALARHDWEGAYELATVAIGQAPPELQADFSKSEVRDAAERLDVLAEAAWWIGRLDECIAAREQAYAAFDEVGASRAAGRCALALYHHWCFKGKQMIASGWLRRGRRSLEGDPECPEYGFMLLYEAEVAHGAGELERAAALSQTALELGRRLREPDVEAQALQSAGRLLIDQGRTGEGFAHLDEAMLFAVEGRLSPFVTGKVYCSLMSACHELGDVRRANEWIEAVGSWAENHPFTVFPGLCRLHRAEFLQWKGDWVAAEAEARRAGAELQGSFLPNAAAAFAEVGEIRRRIGDLDGAEAEFARAEALQYRPAGGLALLRLAQGRVDAADSIITEALAEMGWNRLQRAWLLTADVQVALEHGNLDRARLSSEELTESAEIYESAMLCAAAATARGRVQIAYNDGDASATLRDAVQQWRELDVPYEVATAHVLLAQAFRCAGDAEGTQRSSAAADALFEQLGATVAARGASPVGTAQDLPCGLTEREVEVLRLVAAGDTNKRIAAELFLSEKTIGRHLSNIFAKIGVSSRAAATAFAFENHLVGA
jgi:DNA-binding NarL/FixJ family response regulator